MNAFGEKTIIELRPGCECCDRDLPPNSADARICSFEWTFCAQCATELLKGKCPNCDGELVPRPRRPANKLANNSPSNKRVFNPHCAQRAKSGFDGVDDTGSLDT